MLNQLKCTVIQYFLSILYGVVGKVSGTNCILSPWVDGREFDSRPRLVGNFSRARLLGKNTRCENPSGKTGWDPVELPQLHRQSSGKNQLSVDRLAVKNSVRSDVTPINGGWRHLLTLL